MRDNGASVATTPRAGLSALRRTFMALRCLQSADVAYGPGRNEHRDAARRQLRHALRALDAEMEDR